MSHAHGFKRSLLIGLVLLLGALATAACSGPQGPPGPEGPQGPPGPQGPAGPPADALSGGGGTAQYVGSETCAQCHSDLYETFQQTGHANHLNRVEGEAPDYPFSSVPSPPDGASWDDILFVVGGYARKALFVDQDGYVLTGDTQFNLVNDDLGTSAGFVSYHEGEEVPYTCGSCHTTGYSGRPGTSQDDAEGIVGTWQEDGIQCEACHGPASQHTQNPGTVKPEIDRSSSLCLECHVQERGGAIPADGLFIETHPTYPDLFQSKHQALDCTQCHNPHTTTHYREEAGTGADMVAACESCHVKQATFFPERHFAPDCLDCHMTNLASSAIASEDLLQGDMPTHLFSINAYTLEQFYEGDDGNQYSQPYITVEYACTQCHSADGFASEKTLEELVTFAQGYHDQDRAGIDLGFPETPEDAEEGEGE